MGKTKEQTEAFNKRLNHLITFFTSSDMVRYEPDPKLRLEKWQKTYEENPNAVPIEKDEAEALKKKLGF